VVPVKFMAKNELMVKQKRNRARPALKEGIADEIIPSITIPVRLPAMIPLKENSLPGI